MSTNAHDDQRPEYVLDRASVRAVDRLAIETYGLPGIVLMENAARAVASEAIALRDDARGSVLVVCGAGNNGGDGWAAARHLHNAGVPVTILALGEPRDGTDALVNRSACRVMKLVEIAEEELTTGDAFDVVIDAIFGTGLTRPVTGPAAACIEWINGCDRPVLAVDLPSGLDCDTGRPLGVAVRATRTVSFVGRKPGFDAPGAAAYTGIVVVADIGAPRELTERHGTPHRG